MGNNNVSVFPVEDNKAPWVMVTYEPGTKYKNFSYSAEFDVYSNKVEMVSNLSSQPTPPTATVVLKVNNGEILEAIRSVNFEDNLTVKDLVTRLLQQCRHDDEEITDADKVKILFYWLTAQNVKYSEYCLTVDFEAVNYQLQKLRDGKNSYAALFALLCHYAEIPCIVVRGHVKGGRYEIDKPLTDDLIREWNAVLVDDEWQFVDTFWGRIYRDRLLSRDEWYLFPDPAHLIYSHLPENVKWQLVKMPVTQELFMRQPVLKPRFFQMKMELLSHRTGEVRCSEGELELTFLLNEQRNKDTQEFRCLVSRRNDDKEWGVEKLPDNNLQLDFIQKIISSEEEDGTDDLNENSSNKELLYRRASSSVGNDSVAFTELSVQIRFPRTGYHKVEIVGRRRTDEEYDWVAIYHVTVTYVPDWQVFFPRMTDLGWGPNPYLKQCGLTPDSHTSGEIRCFAPKQLEVNFRILPNAKTNDIKLRYTLKDLSKQGIETTEDAIDDNEIDIFTPDKQIIEIPVFIGAVGEYQLTVAATLNETDKGDVIHYRIVGEVDQSSILNALALEVLTELEKAIESQDLYDLMKAINYASSKKVQNHPKVKSKYKEAQRLYRSLENYQKTLKRIGQIDNKRISILKSFANPGPGVVKVMQAVFVVLGEPENHIATWDDIKPLLKGIGPDALRKRINNVDLKSLPDGIVRKAKAKLGDTNLIEALRHTEDVAAFAKWLEFIFSKAEHSRSTVESKPGCSTEESTV